MKLNINQPARRKNANLRCLWVHNFDPSIPVGGVFMHTLADAMQACGVNVDLLYTGKLSSPLEIWRARALLREIEGGFDIVHAQYGSMCSLVASAASIRKLISLRGSDWYDMPVGPWRQRLHGVLANLLTRLGLPYYDRVVVMSHSMRDEIDKRNTSPGSRAQRIDVVPDGLDLELFQPLDRQTCRQALGQGSDSRPWVLLTTLFEDNPIKRVPLARQAVELARQQLPDLVLKVASNVAHRDMPLWVNACNATLMTSIHEGWPNAIKESLACNVPFVSTDVSDLGLISALEPSCKTVAADPQALADALIGTLQNPTGNNLRIHVKDMEVRVIARRLRHIYYEMMDTPCAD